MEFRSDEELLTINYKYGQLYYWRLSSVLDPGPKPGNAFLSRNCTDGGAFPVLCRVTIQLAWYSCERDEEEVGHLLGNLTKDQFPRLRESSKIQFRFDEEHQFII